MKPKIPQIIALLFLVVLPFLLYFPFSGEADEAKITDIIITQSTGNLLVFATLKDCFTKEIEEGIVNGISTSFTYHVRLIRGRNLWTDQEVARLSVKQTVVYDLLKDRFSFTSQLGNHTTTSNTNSFVEIKRWMSTLNGISLASYRDLKPGELYYVQARAEIRSVKLVFPLNVLLFFISFWNIDTPWTNSALFNIGK